MSLKSSFLLLCGEISIKVATLAEAMEHLFNCLSHQICLYLWGENVGEGVLLNDNSQSPLNARSRNRLIKYISQFNICFLNVTKTHWCCLLLQLALLCPEIDHPWPWWQVNIAHRLLTGVTTTNRCVSTISESGSLRCCTAGSIFPYLPTQVRFQIFYSVVLPHSHQFYDEGLLAGERSEIL